MTNSYLKTIEKRKSRKATLDFYFFGFGFGHILLILSFIGWLTNQNLAIDIIYIIGIIIGTAIIISTLFIPELTKIFLLLFQKIGSTIFSAILTSIYIIFFIPIGRILTPKTHLTPKTTFISHKPISTQSSRSKIIHSLNILKFFINERSFFIVPILIILIILGLLLAFVQTSFIAPLIYTFF